MLSTGYCAEDRNFTIPPNGICTTTYLYLYQLSPWSSWTGVLPSKYSICLCCSWKKILWDLIEGRVQSPTRKNALFATDFQQMHWQSDSRPPVAWTDTSWVFTSAPFSQVAALIPLGGCQTNPPWVALPGTEVLDDRALALTTRCHCPYTLRRSWTLGLEMVYAQTRTHPRERDAKNYSEFGNTNGLSNSS